MTCTGKLRIHLINQHQYVYSYVLSQPSSTLLHLSVSLSTPSSSISLLFAPSSIYLSPSPLPPSPYLRASLLPLLSTCLPLHPYRHPSLPSSNYLPPSQLSPSLSPSLSAPSSIYLPPSTLPPLSTCLPIHSFLYLPPSPFTLSFLLSFFPHPSLLFHCLPCSLSDAIT